MPCLALILEFHHPLPAPGRSVGTDWVEACVETYWPLLQAIDAFVERAGEASITLAVSPSWTSMASDPRARVLTRKAVEEAARRNSDGRNLLRFFAESGDGDAIHLLRRWAARGSVDLIPTTATHTWLPSLASDPVLARAQVGLAASDHDRCFGTYPRGFWLPFLAYPVGIETTLSEYGLRYFGVSEDAFVRGTVLPPSGAVAPMITPAGVAAFAVSASASAPAVDPHIGYGLDSRYEDPATARRAARDHAKHFVERWAGMAGSEAEELEPSLEPISVVALSAQDLARGWPRGGAELWLRDVLENFAGAESAHASSLDRYLNRNPVGPVGRPGPSAGGMLAARPGGSDLFDRCRAAADVLAFVAERRCGLTSVEREVAAEMVRCLLRAQQIDWSYCSKRQVASDEALGRASVHLSNFYTQAAELLSGRPARPVGGPGPQFLPTIDLDLLAGG